MNDIDALSNAIMVSLSEYHDKEFLMRRARDFSIENISKQYLKYFGLIEE